MGEFDYQEFGEVNAVFAAVFFFTFIVLVFFVLLNIFIGIINEAYAQEQAKPITGMLDEFDSWLTALKQDISAPFLLMMEQAKEMALLAEEMAKSAQKAYEERKRREAIGTNLVLKFRDEEKYEWADLAKSLWPTPNPKVEDSRATFTELLKYYTEAYEDTVPFLEEVNLSPFYRHFNAILTPF